MRSSEGNSEDEERDIAEISSDDQSEDEDDESDENEDDIIQQGSKLTLLI